MESVKKLEHPLQKTTFRYSAVFVSLIVLFFVALVLSINIGSVKISILDIFKIIFLNGEAGSSASVIIWKIRLPRIFTAALLGGALSVSGFLLQTFFRNPIAGPFVLGLSSGAKMCVSFVMIIMMKSVGSMPSFSIVLAAFIGSLLSMAVVLLFAKKVNNMSMLLVIGIMIGYICSAATDFFITFAKENEIADLYTWSIGSFNAASWQDIRISAIIIGISLVGVMLLSKPMGAYQLGEGYAKSMGINIKTFRILLILFASILSAVVVAYAGPISFVGIAVPHIAKKLMKTTKPIVIIPTSFLCGTVFCMLADLLSRTIFSPVELAISTVTALFGAPIVIKLMLTNKKKATG